MSPALSPALSVTWSLVGAGEPSLKNMMSPALLPALSVTWSLSGAGELSLNSMSPALSPALSVTRSLVLLWSTFFKHDVAGSVAGAVGHSVLGWRWLTLVKQWSLLVTRAYVKIVFLDVALVNLF